MSNNYFNSTGTIGFTCDVCGRELQSCTWINGMSFCAKCYQETFRTNTKEITYVYGGNLKEHIKVIEEKDQKIADLEAKLAESEKTREYFADRVEKADREIKENYKNYNKLVEEYNELKQQLAESEEDVDKLKSIIGRLTYYLDKFNYVGEHPFYNTTRDQDKVSFAVERLEKVSQDFSMRVGITDNNIDLLNEVIDNQIEELKKEIK